MKLHEEFKLYENMWEAKHVLAEGARSATGMYIVAADGEAGGEVYYIGRSKTAAQKEHNAVAADWLKLGLGGGDTDVYLYEYFGPI
jgi:hypothetical protein